MPLIPHMTTITMGADNGNTSLAVPPAHPHLQQVCPETESEQLAQARPAEKQLEIRLKDTAYPGKPAVVCAAITPLIGDCPGKVVCAQPTLFCLFSSLLRYERGGNDNRAICSKRGWQLLSPALLVQSELPECHLLKTLERPKHYHGAHRNFAKLCKSPSGRAWLPAGQQTPDKKPVTTTYDHRAHHPALQTLKVSPMPTTRQKCSTLTR